MNNFNIEVPVDVLKGALMCAADKDNRYCLNGVNVRVDSIGHVYIESTRGTILFQDRLPTVIDQKGPFNIIIPRETVKLALTGQKKGSVVVLKALDDGKYMLGGCVFSAIDGRYPDLSSVIPSSDSVSMTDVDPEHIQFDPDLLVTCRDALNTAMGTKRVCIGLRFPKKGSMNNASLMKLKDRDYPFCVVMPIRINAVE